MVGSEVDAVIRALHDNGIAVTASQPHARRQPHLFFMHYWASDDALMLARGLRASFDVMNIKEAG